MTLRHSPLAIVAAALIALLGPLPARGAAVKQRPIPVVDLRVDLGQRTAPGRSLDYGRGPANARRLRTGRVVGVVVPTAASRSDERSDYGKLLRAISHSDHFARPGAASYGGRIRTWLSVSATESASASELRLWHSRGARFVTLTATVAGDPAGGLSARDRELVGAARAAGLALDIAPLSDSARSEVLESALSGGGPTVVALGVGARAITERRLNLSDEHIAAIARTGGVVAPGFDARLVKADVVRHLRHIARVGGPDSVAIASGFESDARPPAALPNAGRFPMLRAALRREGVPDREIARIFHGNALRVLSERPLRGLPGR